MASMEILPPLEEEDKMLAALAYPFWFVVSWMILLSGKKKDPFVKFHALQALFHGIISTLAIVLLIAAFYLVFLILPGLGNLAMGIFFLVAFMVVSLLALALLLLVFFFAYRASEGKYFKIPVLGNFIERTYMPKDREF